MTDGVSSLYLENSFNQNIHTFSTNSNLSRVLIGGEIYLSLPIENKNFNELNQQNIAAQKSSDLKLNNDVKTLPKSENIQQYIIVCGPTRNTAKQYSR